MEKSQLSAEEELLPEVILNRRRDLLPVIAQFGVVPLTEEQRRSLEDALADELSATGFNQDWQINERGERLENIIHFVLEVAK